MSDQIDEAAAVDQELVTSTVSVNGTVTVRTYSDGSVQRNVWESEQEAADYAASVTDQGA